MAASEPPLINSQTLRINAQKSSSKTPEELEEEAYEAAAYSSSWGVVVCYKDGIGEVIVSESFDDVGIHFLFTRTTNLQYPLEYDPLGIGSVVHVFWSRSFERVVRGSHVVVQIEKMEVYKCATMFREKVFVTFNSQNAPGVALGVTERNITVTFHPNCADRSRYETLKAFNAGRTEFDMTYKHHENTNRMVDVMLATVPFRVEIRGNVEKIPFFVIHKIGYVTGKEGVAVITKILKHHFMEAYFLKSSERVYFDSKSCHSNILDKVSVGSLINVLASPTFATSFYRWYGYDVTMCNKYLACAEIQKSFKMKNNVILDNFGDEKVKPSLKYARSAFNKEQMPLVKEEEEVVEEEKKVKKKKPMNLYKFESRNSQYKLRHILLDACYNNLDPRVAKMTVDSYFMERMMALNERHRRRYQEFYEEVEMRRPDSAMYSESMQDRIRDVLEPFNLNRPSEEVRRSESTNILVNPTIASEGAAHKKKKKPDEPKPRLTPEDVRNRIGSLMDSEGFALNQKVAARFDLPDTRWKPRERRWIGLDDDVQWVLMAMFCPIEEDPEQKEPLAGGWWYRRGVPREAPVLLVERMETRRNVIKDCTESMLIE